AYLAADEQDAFEWIAELLDYLPAHNCITQESNFQQDLETTVEDLALDTIVPDSANQPYDLLEVIATIVDDGALLQVQERYAPNIIVGLGRVEGRPDVIKSVTGEDVNMETLGGGRQHNETSGTAAYLAADEQDA